MKIRQYIIGIVVFSVSFSAGFVLADISFKPKVQQVTETIVVPIEEVHTQTIEDDCPQTIEEESESTSIMCKLTAYCCENYPHICNNGDATYTATMTTPTPGRTVAVDPTLIPYGSEVTIKGHTYIAEDCGGAIQGNRVDILFATHEEALNFGIQYAEVQYVKS